MNKKTTLLASFFFALNLIFVTVNKKDETA